MNEAAKLLWSRLRGRKPGRPHFRREHPLGPYTADFWCAAAKVVIEVDGFTHEDAYAKRHDELRDAWMAKQGILVLRFRNEAVYETLTGVVDEIRKTCADGYNV